MRCRVNLATTSLLVLLLGGTISAGEDKSDPPQLSAVSRELLFDQAHGQNARERRKLQPLVEKLGLRFNVTARRISPNDLEDVKILYVRAPQTAFSSDEKQAIVAFVRNGGSFLLAVDEERRVNVSMTGVNDLIAPFGLKLTDDTPYLHNRGAVAKAGEIHHADREIPYSGGRSVTGGQSASLSARRARQALPRSLRVLPGA